MGYKLCKECGQPVLKKGQKRKHPEDYRHATGCPLSRYKLPKPKHRTAKAKSTLTEGESMWVKWECGCVGLHLGQQDIVVKACNVASNSPEFGFNLGTQCANKAFSALAPGEAEGLIKLIHTYVVAGQDYSIMASELLHMGTHTNKNILEYRKEGGV